METFDPNGNFPLTMLSIFQQLYTEGARFFWLHNTGPIGCLPYSIIYYQAKPRNLDENGCVEPQNAVAREFNRQLKNTVSKLREQLPNAAFTYVDVYSAKYALISNASNQGFEDPSKFCCGSYYGYHVDCGKKEVVNSMEQFMAIHALAHQGTLAGMAYATLKRPTRQSQKSF
ncbi:hypothetical protein RJ639_032439 [Escallonia herrerae]|uniref:GDSL esterase/lipase n=1 Tax=Escallonia herrerae TaxID=1293975 RepID=A0AA88WT50_9ASTE|nr:hypothetical protein RJ639_032439 [Escallonia herrerae]